MKAIIIDDELDSIESLEAELNAYCPDIEIISTYNNPIEAKTRIHHDNPDIVFLDIEMPEMNGFEFLESIESIDFHVIFVTAYDEYAINAFEFNATDYLLKPVRRTKLEEAVEKCKEKENVQLDSDGFKALINNIKLQHRTNLETIALPTSDGYEFVHINDVAYIKAESNYSWVHLTTGEKYLLAKTLKQIGSILNFTQFFRSHNSWIANLNHVKKYVRGQGGYLVMKDRTHIPVSRQRKDELMQILVL